MSRPTAPVDPAPDVRGRTVVWSAGSPPTRGRGGTGHGAWRAAALVVAAVAAVVTLAYAVQAWHVITPPPAGASVPLWLPDRLDADGAEVADTSGPTTRPFPVPGHDRVVATPATVPTSRPHPAAPRRSQATREDHPAASGHGPSRSPSSGSGSPAHHGSDDRSGHPTASSSSGGHDDGSSGHGSSGGGSDDGSSSGSRDDRSARDGSGRHGKDGHGSNGGSSGQGSSGQGSSGHGGSGGGKDHDREQPGSGGSGS